MAKKHEFSGTEAKLIEEGRLFTAYARALETKDPLAARNAFEAFCLGSGLDPEPLLPSHGWEYLR